LPKSHSQTSRQTTQRIVSLAPSVTSILFSLGAQRHLVGATKWCADVAPVSRLPRLGDCWSGDASDVAKLRPTLLIGSVPYKSETMARLADTGAPLLAMNPHSLEDIYADIRLLGRMTGRAARAETVVGEMLKGFKAIARRAARAKSRPRVYCEAWSHPRISSPPWVNELVEIAGGKPVLPAGQTVSDAEVAQAQPEVIVLAWAATGTRAEPRTALNNPLWRDLPAVRNGRVTVIRDEWLNTPSPILLKGAQALLRVLHPELVARARPLKRGARGVLVR
jgi:iron complex transport system substrate-binding protein